MRPATRFVRALEVALVDDDEADTPTRLAELCVRVLGVDAASITMHQRTELPLGSSHESAARMEQVQTTLGDGPWTLAAGRPSPVVLRQSRIAACWPLYHAELLDHTPFRSVACVPMATADHPRFGFLDLFSTDPRAARLATVAESGSTIGAEVTTRICSALADAARQRAVPPWLWADPMVARAGVGIAAAMLEHDQGLSDSAALTSLRRYAYLHGLSLDAVASRLTFGALSCAELVR